MKLTKVNVSKDIDNIFKYKGIIENILLENKSIDKSISIEEFIDFLDFSKYIYIEGAKSVVPFCVQKINDEESVLFHMCDDETKLFNLIETLTVIKFNFSNLVKLSNEDLLKMDLDTAKMFIINDEYFGFK